MIDFLGWLGAILFVICGLPQAWQVHKTKSVNDISMLFLQLWLWGEIFSFTYILNNDGTLQWPLITNYVLSTVIVGYLVWAKIVYKKAVN